MESWKSVDMTETGKNHNGHLTRGRLLARNTVWNLLGSGAPMLVAVFCIPIIIRELGKERFGVLTLAWALVGYASLFDFGLGRALTQLVAKKLGAGEEREVPNLVWTTLLLMLLLGIVGAAMAILLSPWLVHRILNVPVALQRETLLSFYLLGLSIPMVIGTAGPRGFVGRGAWGGRGESSGGGACLKKKKKPRLGEEDPREDSRHL